MMGARRLFPTRYTKGALAVLDQAIYSLGNFLLNVLLARWLSPSDYGFFALGFAVLLFFQGFQNALVLEPMSILGLSRYRSQLRGYLLAQLGLHSAVTVPVGLTLILIGVLIRLLGQDTPLSFMLIAVGAVLPFHGLGWLGRRFFYVLQRPAGSLWVSGANFLVSMGLLLILWFWHGLISLTGLGVLGFAGVVSGSLGVMMFSKLFGQKQSGGGGTPSFREILREHWRLGRWLMLLVPLGLVSQAVVLVPAATLGLAETGALRALANLVLPIQQTVVALSSLALPTLAATFARGSLKRFVQKATVVTLVLTSLSLGYATFLSLVAPVLERLLYGGKYADFLWAIPFLTVDAALAAVVTSQVLMLKAMERTDYAVLSGAMTGVFLFSLAAGLTLRYGIGGLLGGMIASRILALFLNFGLVRRALAKLEVAR